MLQRSTVLFGLFWTFAVSSMTAKDLETSRQSKILPIFQVVTFPNDPCIGSNKNGTCYTSAECSNKGGTNEGSCANGYGICCVFTLTCGASRDQNCTYFESSGTASAGACRAMICPCSNNICQLRLDFNTFVITGPSTLTTSQEKILNGSPNTAAGANAETSTRCLTDSFSVTSTGGQSPPTICGTNTGEHMFVDMNKACQELAFQLGTSAIGAAQATRSWSIKITQYDCNFRNLAPSGCTQYYYGSTSGQVRTYNYNAGSGYHLANQNQKICIRRERSNCRICWTTSTSDDFNVSGMAAGGLTATCCGYGADGKKSNYDCVQIPGATKATDSLQLKAMGFCGRGGLVTKAGTTLATICSRRNPFQIRFQSDAYEITNEDVAIAGPPVVPANRGFQLTYIMSC